MEHHLCDSESSGLCSSVYFHHGLRRVFNLADALRANREKINTDLYPLVFFNEAELMEAAFTVEKEAIEVAIDTAVAILCEQQLAVPDFVDGCVWIG